MKANKSTTAPAAATKTAKGTKTKLAAAVKTERAATKAKTNKVAATKLLNHEQALKEEDFALHGTEEALVAPAPAAKPAKSNKPAPAKPAGPTPEEQALALAAAVAAAKLNTPAPAPVKVEIPMLRKSLVKTPVFASWDMFDSLRKAAEEAGTPLRRKDAVAYAVAAGIAFYTARTQYQSWKTANGF